MPARIRCQETTVDARAQVRAKTLGLFLRAGRETRGYSPAEVTESLGIEGEQRLLDWEEGISAPPMNTFLQLADLYGASRGEIVAVVDAYQGSIFARSTRRADDTPRGPEPPPKDGDDG